MRFLKPLFLGIVGLFSVGVQAQHLDKFPTESSSLLWKIEGDKVKKDCYIFGTVHLIPMDKFYFPDKLSLLVAKSKQVVLEIGNIDQMEVLGHLFLEKGTVFDFFTPEQTDSIYVWAKEKMNMDSLQFTLSFGRMKPFFLVQMAAQKGEEIEIASYDLTIQNIANFRKIPVSGLETIAEQIALFDNMDTLTMQKMVMETIKETEEDETFDELVTVYLKQNVDDIYSYITNADSGGFLESSDELLDKRNHNWIPQIEKIIKKKKSFIAVGAGHLGGENGVLRLLEKQGYKLTPIQF